MLWFEIVSASKPRLLTACFHGSCTGRSRGYGITEHAAIVGGDSWMFYGALIVAAIDGLVPD
eukprot:scaffold647914_cov47-Prasinocladus_malaysianus.AAC.2